MNYCQWFKCVFEKECLNEVKILAGECDTLDCENYGCNSCGHVNDYNKCPAEKYTESSKC